MSFIQLKRKCSDDPKEILILASKKRKIENVKEDASIFELAGTAVEKEEINAVIDKSIKGITKRKFDLEKITNQLRVEHLQHSKHNRLQILNCRRNLNEDIEKKDESVAVIDLSHDDESSSKTDYVYDIYYSQNGIDINDPDLINNYLVHEVDSCVWQENPNSDEEDKEGMEDEDDSNDESNWRNDYPDEDDDVDSDDDCEEMFRKMKKAHLSDDSLSSDEFDEDICNNAFNLPRKHRFKKDDDFNYYDEVIDESDSD